MTISYKNKLAALIPTYQSGVYLTCISDSKAFLGNIYSSLEIFDQNLIQLLKCLDGINTLADIAQGCNLSVDQLVQILDRKSTRLNSSHIPLSRMPSSA